MNKDIKVEHVKGKSKKGNDYDAIRLSIGDWSSLVFPRTRFECNYVFSILDDFNGGGK